MAKTLTYQEFMDYAKKYYNRGGDSFYECWDEKTFKEYTEQWGGITKGEALKMFRREYDHEKDVAGYWKY